MTTFAARPTTSYFHYAASLLALAGVVVSSLGIMFVPVTKQDSSQAFPCQGGSCGCTSAAQCWQSCCCTSVAERLAWADANEVIPPAFLVELAAASTKRQLASEPKTCCSSDSSPHGAASSCVDDREIESPAHVVLISDLSRCRGLAKYIAIFGSAICEPLPDAATFDLVASSWLRSHDDTFDSPLPSPPTPPPRIAA
jgi:hypothetical protein